MSERKVSIEQMAEAVMDGLIEYAGLATDVMKDCVTKAGNTVKSEVKANAPVRTGQYKKGWAVKKQKETANALDWWCITRKGISLPTFWRKAMPSVAAGGCGHSPISPLRNRLASGNWRKESKGGWKDEP